MHKFTRPTIATPQAILAGGCDNCRISAAAQFFCVVPTNGTAQPMAPTGFTMGTLRLGSPWAHMSSAVVNGADIFTTVMMVMMMIVMMIMMMMMTVVVVMMMMVVMMMHMTAAMMMMMEVMAMMTRMERL